MAYLFKYDSIHGNYDGEVEAKDGKLVIDGNQVTVFSEYIFLVPVHHRVVLTHRRDPGNIKWGDLDVDVVVESTGVFLTVEKVPPSLIIAPSNTS